MMARVLIFAVVLSGAGVFASQDWPDRPFDTWTPREVRAVLRDSPWAGSVRVRAEMRHVRRAYPWTLKAHAVWSSALPVRQAEWRRENPHTQEASDADRAALAVVPAGYLITVSLDGDGSAAMLVRDADRGVLSAALRQGDVVIPSTRTRGGWLNETGEIDWERDRPLPCGRNPWAPSNSAFWGSPGLNRSYLGSIPASPTLREARHSPPEFSCRYKGAIELEFPRSTNLHLDEGDILFDAMSTRTLPPAPGYARAGEQKVILTKRFDPRRMIAGGGLAL